MYSCLDPSTYCMCEINLFCYMYQYFGLFKLLCIMPLCKCTTLCEKYMYMIVYVYMCVCTHTHTLFC